MPYLHVDPAPFCAVGKLDDAARVRGGDHLRSRLLDVVHLSFLELHRHLRLRDIVDPRAAAAPIRFVQLFTFYARDRVEHLPGRRRDLLSVCKVAGIVVGDGFVNAFPSWRPVADRDQEFVNVLDLFAPDLCPFRILRIVPQQAIVMFHVRPAPP